MFTFCAFIRKKIQAIWDTKKIQTGGMFMIFNVVFPSVDLITDWVSAIELGNNHHQYWSALTCFWMFGPFIFNLLLYIFKLFKKSGHSGLRKVFLHFPFILPLTNTILAIHLMSFDLTNPGNSGTIETIKRTAAISGLYESFLESAPQMLTQIHIILSTGQISDSQKVQMFVHIFTFTLKACKAFYVQRKSSESDPDPSGKMLVMLFPLMLINVINSAAQWTIIAGLLKPFVSIPVCMMIFFMYPLLKKMEEKEKTSADESDNPRTDKSVIERRFSDFRRGSRETENCYEDTTFDKVIKKLSKVAEDAEIDEGCFPLKASLTSVWLPCVVGSYTHTFVISALFSLITRSLVLIGTVIFSYREWYPAYLRERAYLLYCNTEEKIEELNITDTCFSLDECFHMRNMNGSAQLHRVCGDGENEEDFPITMMGILLHLLLFSLISIYFLHRFTSYFALFEVSKIWFSTSPVIHRSLIFQFIRSANHTKLQELGDIIKKETENERTPDGVLKEHSINIEELSQLDEDERSVVTMLDRQCGKGYSPVHLAVLRKDATSVRILLESGAKVEQDSTPQHPITSAFTSDLTCFDMMIKYATKRQIEKAFQQAVESNNIAYSLRLLNHNGSSIPYRSNILLGEMNQSQTIEKFNVAGEGKREIKSITINFSKMTRVTGLELLWSDGMEEVIGLIKDHENVLDSVKVDTPQDSSFSFVRGKTANNFIVEMAIDTVSSSGIVKHGEWMRSAGGNKVKMEEGGIMRMNSAGGNMEEVNDTVNMKKSGGENIVVNEEAVPMRRRSTGGPMPSMAEVFTMRMGSSGGNMAEVEEAATVRRKSDGVLMAGIVKHGDWMKSINSGGKMAEVKKGGRTAGGKVAEVEEAVTMKKLSACGNTPKIEDEIPLRNRSAEVNTVEVKEAVTTTMGSTGGNIAELEEAVRRIAGGNMEEVEEAGTKRQRSEEENITEVEEDVTMKKRITGGNMEKVEEAVTWRKRSGDNSMVEVDEAVTMKMRNAGEKAVTFRKRSSMGNKNGMEEAFTMMMRSAGVNMAEVEEAATMRMKNARENMAEVEEAATQKHEVIDTLGMLDIEDLPIRCVLDGFKGHLDANMVNANVANGEYDYEFFLSNLAVIYRISSFSN